MNPQTKIIRYELEANLFDWEIAPGKVIQAWGYNGQIPGPTLRAKVGDTLIVRLKNNLQEPTTIHWHGLRIPADMDGTEEVQAPVMPGETFEYRLELKDAGTFWYHPHTNETVQMERGLYGAIVVEEVNPELVFDVERVLVLDDMKLDKNDRFAKPNWFLPRWIERHDGRQGDVRLVNGKQEPVISLAAGQTERWRIVNAASARFVNLSFEGKPFQIIATDGGLIERPVTVTELLITPGERVELAIGPFAEGEEIKIQSLVYDRGSMIKTKEILFATIQVGAAQTSKASMPIRMRNIAPLAPADAAPTREIHLSGKRTWTNGVDFMINNHQHLHDKPVKVGELQIWDVYNDTMMDHPFHLHGFFFQVLEINRQSPEFISWKDTVNIPRFSKARIAWLPDQRTGMWMYHCHILEHVEAGMMAHFEVAA